jgi:nicotinic acid mononucleotide adenylyltransferase
LKNKQKKRLICEAQRQNAIKNQLSAEKKISKTKQERERKRLGSSKTIVIVKDLSKQNKKKTIVKENIFQTG